MLILWIGCMWLGVALPLRAHAISQTAPHCIAIVGTNDVHGVVEPHVVEDAEKKQSVQVGGVLGTSAYLHNLRQRYGARMLVLDGGDIFQGSLPSNSSFGQVMIDAYNAMGYDAAAIGNHEFDFGALPNADANIAKNRLGILKQRIAEAHFPFLAVNIVERDTGKPIAWPNVYPSIIKDLDGIRVGILGASTPTTPLVTNPQNVETLRFLDPAPLVVQEAARLRAQGAQLVVLVAHMGGRCGAPQNQAIFKHPFDLTACHQDTKDAELLALLERIPEGTLDVAIGGHTHQFIGHWIQGVATLESGARGQYLGWIEACVKPKTSGQASPELGIEKSTSQIHPAIEMCLQNWDDGTCRPNVRSHAVHPAQFLQQNLTIDAETQKVVAPYLQQVEALAQMPIGRGVAAPISKKVLAQWIAEALRQTVHADFGLQNQGGIRMDLRSGFVRYQDIYEIVPFDNYVTKVRLTGAQITELVRVLHQNSAHNGIPGLSGMQLCGAQLCTDKGVALDPTRVYTLATTDYMLQGGDGAGVVFQTLPPEHAEFTSIGMRDALITLLKRLFAEQR